MGWGNAGAFIEGNCKQSELEITRIQSLRIQFEWKVCSRDTMEK